MSIAGFQGASFACSPLLIIDNESPRHYSIPTGFPHMSNTVMSLVKAPVWTASDMIRPYTDSNFLGFMSYAT